MYPEELKEFFINLGEPAFRAEQVFKWLHNGCASFDDMSNISKPLRQKLNDVSYIANVKIVKKKHCILNSFQLASIYNHYRQKQKSDFYGNFLIAICEDGQYMAIGLFGCDA